MSEPRAWVGCLACYNGGRLVGEWVDGTEAGDYVPCQNPSHEERWVFDHEGTHGLVSGECSPADFQSAAETLAELDDDETRAAFAACVSEGWFGSGAPSVHVQDFRDRYLGRFDHVWEYVFDNAQDLYGDQLKALPDEIRGGIDWRQVAHDMDANGGWFVTASAGAGDAVYVLRWE